MILLFTVETGPRNHRDFQHALRSRHFQSGSYVGNKKI